MPSRAFSALVLFGALASELPSSLAFLPPAPLRAPLRAPHAKVSRARSVKVTGLTAKLEAIFFDCDGVLADTERDGHRIAFNLAFEEAGLMNGEKPMQWDEELYGKLVEIGGGKERMMGYWESIGYQQGSWELAMKLHERKTQIFKELIAGGKIPLRPGVTRIVDQALAAGVKIAVCSTSNEKAVQQIVDMMGPQRAKEIKIFAGDCVPRKKPSPDIYNLAKSYFNVRPEDSVVIEDSMIGLEAAKSAEMSCLITKSTYTKNEDFSDADLVVDDLDAGQIDLDRLEGLAISTAWEDWGIDRDVFNAGVGRGRW
uniref:Uncharacterized protein n=1 Tax=Hanusia phi TaxID=3032 RepID=A0A7S0HEI8_9CRYP|mmetsp:Transcript_15282/g.35037  ORF Transcript_15282/g.35037 Transcript_15282/m.35037 type:complete len:313 (+) Transcript_15282:15-953(+)